MELRTSLLFLGSLSGNKFIMTSQREMTNGKQSVLRIIADEWFRVDLNKDYHIISYQVKRA